MGKRRGTHEVAGRGRASPPHEAESPPRPAALEERSHTHDEVVDLLRERLAIQGARTSYLLNCESMQRIHISPTPEDRQVERVTRDDVDRLAHPMLRRGLARKTVRDVMSYVTVILVVSGR
jgi:hypothetical protein